MSDIVSTGVEKHRHMEGRVGVVVKVKIFITKKPSLFFEYLHFKQFKKLLNVIAEEVELIWNSFAFTFERSL